MSEGGFGVPPMSDILHDAWIGSWSLAMTGVRHLLPQGVAPPKVEGAVEPGEISLASELRSCFYKCKELETADLQDTSFTRFLNMSFRKFQAGLSFARHRHTADFLLSFLSQEGQARFRGYPSGRRPMATSSPIPTGAGAEQSSLLVCSSAPARPHAFC